MRLWSVHPKYLDCKGLVAVWREGLLAKKVLMGETRGYKKHPQLERFKKHRNPIAAIDTFLLYIWNESKRRCYKFDRGKIGKIITKEKIEVTKGQILFEFELLKRKMQKRVARGYQDVLKIKKPAANPLFEIKNGYIENWEKPKPS
jgi:hypothetical protein